MIKLTKKQVFEMYAEAYNFKLDADEILEQLLDEGILLTRNEKFDSRYSLDIDLPEHHGEE